MLKVDGLKRKVISSALLLALSTGLAHSADLIVSANDGKYQRVNGHDTFPVPAAADTLTVFDASKFPMKLLNTVPVNFGIQGPPQAVAITPNGKLAFVSAPTTYDYQAHKLNTENFLQVVSLDGTKAEVKKLALPTNPQGIAVNPQGTLALASGVDGVLYVLTISGDTVTLSNSIKLSSGRLAGISFTHDGKHALVALRDQQGLAVVNIDDGKVSDSRVRLSSGVAPYTIDVSSNGHWAVVSNVGLAGLADDHTQKIADGDSVSLIDTSVYPFKTVQYLTVPSTPEGVAISPDGKWIAVLSMDGSNLPKGSQGQHDKGKLTLFTIEHGTARQVSEVEAATAGQGVLFSKDSQHIIAQFNVEKQLVVYSIQHNKLVKLPDTVQLTAGPASIRSTPR